MIECIFTLDYEIYGNGTGSLADLVCGPAQQLKALFLKWNARFVNFVEVAEFEKIEECGTDPAIDLVARQVKELRQNGFEIALHLHPQWYNGRHQDGRWILDPNEYNLCTLPRPRIEEIVRRSLAYMRRLVDDVSFAPLSFRAGNWLFQPTSNAADVLFGHGLRIDSSVFKGGVQRERGLDYRPAAHNGYYWRFQDDVNRAHPLGSWIELPIYSKMVPFWKMATPKRLRFKSSAGPTRQNVQTKWSRRLDLLRPFYPLKLDFCRMTFHELTSLVDEVIREDRGKPEVFRPIVSIGHTKDLVDLDTVDAFLSYLKMKEITVSTFADIYPRLAEFRGTPDSGRLFAEESGDHLCEHA